MFSICFGEVTIQVGSSPVFWNTFRDCAYSSGRVTACDVASTDGDFQTGFEDTVRPPRSADVETMLPRPFISYVVPSEVEREPSSETYDCGDVVGVTDAPSVLVGAGGDSANGV